jgi:hypothetical protein
MDRTPDCPTSPYTGGMNGGMQRDVGAVIKRLQTDLRRDLLDFLRAEVSLCFTLASSAESQCETGNLEHARHSLDIAQKGYATVERFLADPKHNRHLSSEEKAAFATEVGKLKGELHRLRSQIPTAPSPPPPRKRTSGRTYSTGR